MGFFDFLLGKPAKTETLDKVGAGEYRSDVAARRARLPKLLQDIQGAYSISPEEERQTREQVLVGLGRGQAAESARQQSMLSKVIGGLRSGYAQNRLAAQQRGYLEQLASTGTQLGLQQAALKRGLAQQGLNAQEQAYSNMEQSQRGTMDTQYQQTTQGTSGALAPLISLASIPLSGGTSLAGMATGAIGNMFSRPPEMPAPQIRYARDGGRTNTGDMTLVAENKPEMFYPEQGAGTTFTEPTIFMSTGPGQVKKVKIPKKMANNAYTRTLLNKGNAGYGAQGKAAGKRPGVAGLGQGYQGWRGQLARA